MAPMGIRLSPLGVAVFILLGLGVIYHLYAGVISSHLAVFRQKKVDLRDMLALAVQSAEEGGIEVKRVREHNTLEEKSKGKTKEGANEFLTQGDLSSHKKMYYLIKNTYTDLQVNSEEHDDSMGDDRVWDRHIPDEILQKVRGGQEVAADRVTVWIDPLDATQEYTENLLQYVTTMVCVAVDGKPVIGVIHNPFSAYTAWAYVGEGTNMRTRSSYSLSPPRVIVSRSHAGKVQKFVHNTFGQNTTIIPAGGAGYKVLSLLEPSPKQKEIDQADIYMHITLIKKWDICAGAAILSALGGQMTTLDGKDIDYRSSEVSEGGLVATVGLDHKALLEKLSDWEAYKY